MTHLVVTGGLGFIGSHVVEAAVGRGWRVTVVDSLRPDVHASAEVPDWFSSLHGDLDLLVADAGAIPEALLRSADAVCHQAAKVGLGVDFGDAPDYVDSNVGVTARLLARMAAAGTTRLVLASSMVVYGEGLYRDGHAVVQPPVRAVADLRAGRFDPLDREGRPLQPLLIREDDPTEPRNVYAVTKLAQEQLARSWARSTGGRVVALRYHNVFGARMPSGTPYAGVASLFRSRLDQGLAPLVFEDGRQRRDFVDAIDVAAANVRAIEWLETRPEGAVHAYNVGSGTVRTIGEFASAIADALGGPAPVVTGDFRLGDVRHITASSERIAVEIGWRAQRPWRDAVRAFTAAPMRRRVTASPLPLRQTAG
ncbi:NAD-dependent epimerase/dehydratase family protein [Leifsonia soli]|uniref:UDP-glucose 4-epimerase n=1 Tax=Leifsonia soli TaxID=582665 RepID=A0A852T325_9MICO|nr:dTDP-L-rhamnose 4-epimerase [Leifsonia soli]